MPQGSTALLLAFAAIGCGGTSTAELEAKAARDLGCKESRVVGRVTDEGRFLGIARGCGQKRTYELWCALRPDGSTNQCEWIAEGTVTSSRK